MAYSTLTAAGGLPDINSSTLVRAVGSSINPIRSTLTRAVGSSTSGVFVVDAGAAVTSDPFSPVTLAAVVNTGTPDSWVWELVSSTNPRVTGITPTDPFSATTSYYAPATVNGVTLTWRVTASTGGFSSVDTVVHTIRNHPGPWLVVGGGIYQPIQMVGNYGPDDIPV